MANATALTPSQQATVTHAGEALTTSHQLDLGSTSDQDLHRNIGRLEIALAQALRVIKELTKGT